MNPPPPRIVALLAATMVVLHLALGLGSAARQSVTVDEIFHLTGGYCFNALGDYRVHPDNGVLPQRLHALPAVLWGAEPPTLAGNPYWTGADSYVLSYQFFYESGNDHWPLLLGARAMNALFGAGILVLVWLWARRLAGEGVHLPVGGPASPEAGHPSRLALPWTRCGRSGTAGKMPPAGSCVPGEVAGLAALALAALSPTLLAHGPLATTDVAAAFFLTASAGAYWAHLREGGGRWLGLSATVFGLACVTKFSAVLLLPVFGLLIAVHLAATPRADWRTGRIGAGLALHAVAAWAIIWACFGFRYAAAAPGLPPAEHLAATWSWMLERAGWQGGVLRTIGELRLLPEAFLWGYTHTYLGSLERAAYLAGEYSTTGWRSFFPLAFLWKSTPAELAGLALALLLAGGRWRALRPWLVRFAPLLALAAVYGGVALQSRLNIGHRHLLPLYPALFIVAGVAAARPGAARSRGPLLTAAGLAGLQAVSAAGIAPHFLAYFNGFAGGPAHGWRLLVDSSLDWGQDLRGLQARLEREPAGPGAPPVYLSYFGSGEPGYYGMRVRRLPFVNGFKLAAPYVPLEAGLYAVSATMLVQVYSPVRGPWTPELEKEYQELRRLEPLFAEYTANPARRAELERDAPAEQWRRGWARHDLLRFARLCHYLRVRPPDDHVGHSILLYRLTAAEVAAATAGSLPDWRAAIERAAQHPR